MPRDAVSRTAHVGTVGKNGLTDNFSSPEPRVDKESRRGKDRHRQLGQENDANLRPTPRPSPRKVSAPPFFLGILQAFFQAF